MAMSQEITNDDGTISDKSLPFELIESILSRLPVKSLKRFRAVEKSWRSLIDSEVFAKKHLRRSLQTNSNRHLISGVYGLCHIGLDSLDESDTFVQVFDYDYGDVRAVSNSINGLVVVKRGQEPPALWNPFTREFKVLPKCPIDFAPSASSCKTTYGFGYDSKNDDYKVVKVMLYDKPSSYMYSEEWIYGLKSDCWRRTDGTYYGRGEWPIHVNGSLHTIVQKGPELDHMKIMGFSVVTEKDYEVSMPGIDSKGLVCVSLDVFDGCLALVCYYRSRIVIWVMEEYGVKESWKTLLSLPLDANKSVRPLVYSKDRDKILLHVSGKGIAVFSLRTQTVQNFTIPCTFMPGLCVETLISPNGWDKGKGHEKSSTEKQNKDGETKKGKKEMKKKKKRDDFLSSGFKLVL